MPTVSSTIWRGLVEPSRWVIRLKSPSFTCHLSSKDVTAADNYRFPGHIGILASEQDGYPIRDLVRFCVPSKRRMGRKLAEKARASGLVGCYPGRGNAIDQNLIGREFEREGTREAYDRSLRRGVMGILRMSLERIHRGHIDDPAAHFSAERL